MVVITNILTKILRLSQLTGGYLAGEMEDGRILKPMKVSSAKLKALEEIIDTAIENGEKVVVMARFIAEIDEIQKMLCKKRIGHAVITGSVIDRSGEVNRFQHDPKTKVFVGQIATAGLGITLTAASTMVFYSLDYSMANFEQSRARIHRAGQCKTCNYLYLIASGTIDHNVLRSLRDKVDLAQLFIDDCRNRLS
jgi:SNF2 family DNA or RNA helicase